ncbi:MAG: hypothetical protein JJT96_17705 [Opitutales bacterium]|nr:hypothetical protein [Opitutales bacterium]
MKEPLPKILAFSLALSVPATLSAQSLFSDDFDFVRTAVTFNTTGAFTPDNPINFEAAGNTITAADFMTRVATAFANNHGGVINFEDNFVVSTGSDTTIANIGERNAGPTPLTNLRAQNLIANLGASGSLRQAALEIAGQSTARAHPPPQMTMSMVNGILSLTVIRLNACPPPAKPPSAEPHPGI